MRTHTISALSLCGLRLPHLHTTIPHLANVCVLPLLQLHITTIVLGFSSRSYSFPHPRPPHLYERFFFTLLHGHLTYMSDFFFTLLHGHLTYMSDFFSPFTRPPHLYERFFFHPSTRPPHLYERFFFTLLHGHPTYMSSFFSPFYTATSPI